MANQKSDYLENKVVEHVLRNVTYTPPATVYVGLFTAPPGESGGGTEVAGGSYARQPVTFGAAVGGLVSNSSQVTFPTCTGSDWGTITDFAIFDALSGGNELYYGTLTSPVIILVGSAFVFAVNQLTVQEL